MVKVILEEAGATDHELWLSGPDNFRYDIYPEYKGNRKDAYRPKWEKAVKEYLCLEWDAKWSEGCEADDVIGIQQCSQENTIACHLDKDINMIPGWHYNWELRRLGKIVRESKKYFVTPEEATYWFYYQLLVGDTTDNIKGVVGIGPKNAKRILSGCVTEQDFKEAVRAHYSSDEEMEMNAQCLWIWRKPNDIWKLNSGVD